MFLGIPVYITICMYICILTYYCTSLHSALSFVRAHSLAQSPFMRNVKHRQAITYNYLNHALSIFKLILKFDNFQCNTIYMSSYQWLLCITICIIYSYYFYFISSLLILYMYNVNLTVHLHLIRNHVIFICTQFLIYDASHLLLFYELTGLHNAVLWLVLLLILSAACILQNTHMPLYFNVWFLVHTFIQIGGQIWQVAEQCHPQYH